MSEMSDIDKIRRRIRQLREMTSANGCTEEEAMAAAEKAAELLAKHGMDESDLAAADYAEKAVKLRRSPLDDVWSAVARFADCSMYYHTDGSRTVGVAFFGRSQDVEVAEYVFEVMKGACDRALAEFRRTSTYQRRRTSKTRAAAVKAFQEGLADGLVRKLDAGLWRRYRAAGHGTPADLVVANQDALRDRMLQRYPGMKTARPLASAAGKFRGDAQGHGEAAARQIEVDAGVGAGAARPTALIGRE